MCDFFRLSDSRRARIAPLLPTDVRGKKRPETVDDRPVPSGIVHALRCGGRRADRADIHGPKKTLCNRFVRRAERAVYGKVSSALRQAPRIRLTGCSPTSPCIRVHQLRRRRKRGVLAPMPPCPMVSAAPKADATPGSTPSATTRAAPCFCQLRPAPDARKRA